MCKRSKSGCTRRSQTDDLRKKSAPLARRAFAASGPTLQGAPNLETLDPKKLTNTFLSIPLLLPGDGREVNTIFHQAQNELVFIDNDVVWVKPVVDTSWTSTPKLRCQLYTVLFSRFQGFTLDKNAIAEFLLLKPGPLISGWLKEMIQWNQHNNMFQPFEKLPDFTYKFQFEKGTGAQILSQFYRLQSFLKSHPQKEIPAIDLLQAIISFDHNRTIDVGKFIHSEYLKTQKPHSGPSSQTIKEITGRDSTKSISMTLSNAATYRYLPKKGEEQGPYLPEKALKEVEQFMVMHFEAFDLQKKGGLSSLQLKQGFGSQNPIDKETQSILLEALIPHTYHYLNLSHCAALTDDHLLRFLDRSGPHLTTLNLRGCPEITDEVLPHIAAKCSNRF